MVNDLTIVVEEDASLSTTGAPAIHLLGGNQTVVNRGSIEGTNREAIYIDSRSSGDISITNTGTITSGYAGIRTLACDKTGPCR